MKGKIAMYSQTKCCAPLKISFKMGVNLGLLVLTGNLGLPVLAQGSTPTTLKNPPATGASVRATNGQIKPTGTTSSTQSAPGKGAPASSATQSAPGKGAPASPTSPNAPTKGTQTPPAPNAPAKGTTATASAPGTPVANVTPAAPTGPVIDHTLGPVTSLAFSSDGKRLALGTYGQVVVYDTMTWEPVAVTTQVEENVRALSFNADNTQLAFGCGVPGQDGVPMIWDMNPANRPEAYPKQKDTIEAIAFRKDGKGLLCGASDNRVRYFSALPGVTGSILDEHNGRVQAVAFSPKPDYVFISGGADRIVKVWDMKTMHTVVNFDQAEGPITGLAFINEGQFVGSSLDGRLFWWGIGYDTKRSQFSGYIFRTIGAHDYGVFALGQSADGKRLITCGADKVVTVWNTDGGRIRDFKDNKEAMYSVALNPDGKIAVAGGRDGLIYVWDVAANKLLNTIVPPALPKQLKPVGKKTATAVKK